jgi:single-strand DNA-binding protein
MATSRSLNKVMIIGNLSRDPIIRTTPNGATVCTFGIATNTAWKDENGELKERTEFHNIVSWNKLAEICAQILCVGMLVYLEGEIRTRSWDDEKGVRHYRSEVRISDMKLLDNKGKSGLGLEEAKSAGEKLATSKRSESTEEKKEKKEKKEIIVEKKEEKVEKEEKKEDVAPEDLPF